MAEKKKRKRAGLSEVIPGQLYQRGRFQSWPRKQKDRVLEEHNIGLVVNLWSKVDPEVSGDTRRMYLHWPIYGNQSPNRDQLDAVVKLIANTMDRGQAVLIHCEAGVNRSCFLVACVVAAVHHMNGDWAFKQIKDTCGKVKINPKLVATLMERYG